MFQNKRNTISTVQNIASKVGGHVDRSGGRLPAPPDAAPPPFSPQPPFRKISSSKSELRKSRTRF